LGIGSRLHTALQDYYVPGLTRPVEDTMAAFKARVESDVEQYPAFEEDIRRVADLVDAMLTGYFEWLEETGAGSCIAVLGPEAEVEHKLIEGATVLSKIDARIRLVSDGRHGALEHKSVGGFKDALPRLQTDTQLLTEHLVEFLTLLDEETEPGAEPDGRAQF